MSNLTTMVGFASQQRDKGIPLTPEFKAEMSRLGYLKIHDRAYSRMGRVAKWWHRQFCHEVHND